MVSLAADGTFPQLVADARGHLLEPSPLGCGVLRQVLVHVGQEFHGREVNPVGFHCVEELLERHGLARLVEAVAHGALGVEVGQVDEVAHVALLDQDRVLLREDFGLGITQSRGHLAQILAQETRLDPVLQEDEQVRPARLRAARDDRQAVLPHLHDQRRVVEVILVDVDGTKLRHVLTGDRDRTNPLLPGQVPGYVILGQWTTDHETLRLGLAVPGPAALCYGRLTMALCRSGEGLKKSLLD